MSGIDIKTTEMNFVIFLGGVEQVNNTTGDVIEKD